MSYFLLMAIMPDCFWPINILLKLSTSVALVETSNFTIIWQRIVKLYIYIYIYIYIYVYICLYMSIILYNITLFRPIIHF